ncbi:MAG: hypothetical protein H6R18_1303 [Proteobacteria bacterium]|nr:hypothetical protein [Pseudomonadota bacterium]
MATKLSLDFQMNFDVSAAFSRGCGMTKIIPFANGRAVAFGWGTHSGNYQEGPHQYWLAEIGREGASERILPVEMTHRTNGLMAPLTGKHYLQAFKFGEQFGLLLSTEAVLLFSSIHDEPVTIPIENHFSMLGEPRHHSHLHDSYFAPTHCGNASGCLVPVVLSAPTEGAGSGRHACLLEIDQVAGRARWLHTLPDGTPHTTVIDDYVPSHTGSQAPGGIRLDSTGHLVYDLPPLVYDCAWVDNHWYLYVAGYNKNYIRFGIPLGVLSRNLVDLSILESVFKAQEQSFGHICASLDRLIVSPLRANGPHKGKQTVFTFDDREEHSLTPPRGYTKYHVQEYFSGYYWLTPEELNYNRMPVKIVACK